MTLTSKLATLSKCVRNLLCNPRESVRRLAGGPEPAPRADAARQGEAAGEDQVQISAAARVRAADLARRWEPDSNSQHLESCAALRGQDDSPNPLRAYFDAVREGPGVWKWLHYFEPYHRHLRKFVSRPVTVVEVGVYGGGSLPMWRHYFGQGCRVHGVDIQEQCKAYEDSQTTIHIGDQADRAFWKRFRQSVPDVDVLIDDGGHQPEQQMVTLEEMLPHLRPGGVYICEDVHGIGNRFAAFAHALADELNAFAPVIEPVLVSRPTGFQAAVNSVHLYPFVVVIEKRDFTLTSFSAPRQGTFRITK